jgi:hypothetical protein
MNAQCPSTVAAASRRKVHEKPKVKQFLHLLASACSAADQSPATLAENKFIFPKPNPFALRVIY